MKNKIRFGIYTIIGLLLLAGLVIGTQTTITDTGVNSTSLYQNGKQVLDTSSTLNVSNIPSNSIGNTQLEYDTGQGLTTSDNPTFAGEKLNGDLNMNGNAITGITNMGVTSTYNALQWSTSGLVFHGDTQGDMLDLNDANAQIVFYDKLVGWPDGGVDIGIDGGVYGYKRFKNAYFTGTISTGHGNNELYPMNQAVLNTSNPTFAGATLNGDLNMGANTINITNGDYVRWSSGATITSNSTCLILKSPDGTGVMNICNT